MEKMYSSNSTHKKTFVVLNPVAGKIDPVEVHNKIEHTLRKHDIPHQIMETSKGEDLHLVVKKALDQGFERFVAVGGGWYGFRCRFGVNQHWHTVGDCSCRDIQCPGESLKSTP